MAAADDDTDTTTAPPPAAPPPAAPPSGTGVAPDYQAQLDALVQHYMPQQPQRDTTPVKRSWTSLLGEALAGGPAIGGMTDAEKEIAGSRALMNFGTGLMAASRYSPGQTLFSNLAAGFQGAQRGEIGAEQLAMAQLGAQQDWAQQQAQNRLAALKEAIPLLRMQQAVNIPNPLLTGTTTPAPNTSISAAANGTYESTINNHEGAGKDPNSSAVGGFLSGTWNDFAAANPDLFKGMSPAQILAARSNSALRDQATSWLAKQNAGTLTGAGITPSGQSLGIAHYIGAGPAAKVMAAPDNAPVSSFVSDAAVKANPELGKMTVGQLKQRYAGVPDPGFLKPAPTATAATTTPPAPTRVAATTPPASPFGAGAFAPPTSTVLPAPETQATAPVTTDVVPPVPTPQMTAAVALARKTGKPALIEGAGGLAANPDGSVSTPGGGGLGKRADINAILQGVQTAQTTLPPAGAATAGPAAPTALATTPAAPAIAPPSAFGGGAFASPPARAVVAPPAAPAPQATTQAQQPPAPPAAVTTAPTPGGKLSFEDWQKLHPLALTDEERAAAAVVPPNLDDLRRAQTTAAQQLDLARRGLGGDPNKSLSDYNTATAAITKAQQDAAGKSAELMQTLLTTKRGEQRQLYDAEMQRQNQLDIETQKGEQAKDLARINAGTELEKGDADQGRKDIEALNTNAMAASNMQSLLAMIGPNLKDLPSATVGALLQDHPQAIPFLTKLHLLDGPTANATQLLQGLTAFMATEMKPKGLGPLRIQEMNAFQSALPTLLQSDEGRQKAFAFMNAYAQRVQDEADFAQKYFMRDKPNTAPGAPPGSTVPTRNTYGMWSTIGKSPEQGGLGSVLPMYTGGMKTKADLDNYSGWEQQQQAQPGHAYWGLRKGPDGQRHMELQITPPAGG